MESNKPLSVHMTHQEYEQYKKFLELQKEKNQLLFFVIKEETSPSGRTLNCRYEIYSQDEVQFLGDESFKARIEVLRLETSKKAIEINKLIKENDKLSNDIKFLQQKVNAYESAPTKSFWRSLWN